MSLNTTHQEYDLDITAELVSLAHDLSQVDGKFRIAKNEWDLSTHTEIEAATFLKYDEKRFGRDFELYNFMKKVQWVQTTVVTVVEELLLPIKSISPVWYEVALTRAKTWKVFWEKQQEWDEILATL